MHCRFLIVGFMSNNFANTTPDQTHAHTQIHLVHIQCLNELYFQIKSSTLISPSNVSIRLLLLSLIIVVTQDAAPNFITIKVAIHSLIPLQSSIYCFSPISGNFVQFYFCCCILEQWFWLMANYRECNIIGRTLIAPAVNVCVCVCLCLSLTVYNPVESYIIADQSWSADRYWLHLVFGLYLWRLFLFNQMIAHHQDESNWLYHTHRHTDNTIVIDDSICTATKYFHFQSIQFYSILANETERPVPSMIETRKRVEFDSKEIIFVEKSNQFVSKEKISK